MVNNTYYKDYKSYMCWLPEAAFRQNDSVTDETNDAGDTGYRLPGRFLSQPFLFKKRGRVYTRVAGVGPDWGAIHNQSYGEGKMLLSMEMIDFSMLYFGCKACTTTDDTPSAGKYTHVYATTTARTVPPPSFAIYHRVTNDDTNNNIYWLYTGCEIHSFIIDTPASGPATITVDIRFANVVTATALTTEPGFGVLKPYTLDRSSVSYAKGGVEYAGGCHGFNISYIDGTVMDKAANEEYPGRAINGPRDIQVQIDFAPMEIKCLDDTLITPLAPATASDLDITIKMYRNTTTDYTEFAFQKLWCIDMPDGTWDFQLEEAIFMTHKPTFIIKPVAYETGALLTITEVNALDDDRYET